MKVYNILYYFLFIGFLFNLSSSIEECNNINNYNNKFNNNKLRIVQYNVEWLFVEHNSHFDCPGNKCSWKNKSQTIEHLDDVSNIISTLEPDIINLCEVESCYELNMINHRLKTHSYTPYLKLGTDSGTGQNVGMLTKITPDVSLYRNEDKLDYPIIDSKCGMNTKYKGSTGVSKHYITEFTIYGNKIAFIGAHLIAYPIEPKRCSQREAQGQIIQNIIFNYIQNGYEIIVIGDMNDYDNEILDVNLNKPLSRTLDIIKGLSGIHSGKYNLQSVASKIQMADRYSEWWNSDNDCTTMSVKDFSMIDHVLMTPGLFQYIDNAFIYHGYQEYCDKIHSDHFPVVVDFDFLK